MKIKNKVFLLASSIFAIGTILPIVSTFDYGNGVDIETNTVQTTDNTTQDSTTEANTFLGFNIIDEHVL
jgi:hypothetical protein